MEVVELDEEQEVLQTLKQEIEEVEQDKEEVEQYVEEVKQDKEEVEQDVEEVKEEVEQEMEEVGQEDVQESVTVTEIIINDSNTDKSSNNKNDKVDPVPFSPSFLSLYLSLPIFPSLPFSPSFTGVLYKILCIYIYLLFLVYPSNPPSPVRLFPSLTLSFSLKIK